MLRRHPNLDRSFPAVQLGKTTTGVEEEEEEDDDEDEVEGRNLKRVEEGEGTKEAAIAVVEGATVAMTQEEDLLTPPTMAPNIALVLETCEEGRGMVLVDPIEAPGEDLARVASITPMISEEIFHDYETVERMD